MEINNITSPTVPKLLFTKQEAMEMLQVGERTFRSLTIPFVKVGKRKRYALSDLQTFINRQREDAACLSQEKGKARRITGTTSRSEVIGLEAARKQIALNKQSQLSLA